MLQDTDLMKFVFDDDPVKVSKNTHKIIFYTLSAGNFFFAPFEDDQKIHEFKYIHFLNNVRPAGFLAFNRLHTAIFDTVSCFTQLV